jgi:hypothetical protein
MMTNRKKPNTKFIDPQMRGDISALVQSYGARLDARTIIDTLRDYAEEYEAATATGMLIGEWPPKDEPWEAYWEQAWEMWPVAGKRRSSKFGAKCHFHEQSRKVGPEALLNAINRFVLSPDVEKEDGAYTPALDRWLKQRRWEVWLEEAAPKRIGFV